MVWKFIIIDNTGDNLTGTYTRIYDDSFTEMYRSDFLQIWEQFLKYHKSKVGFILQYFFMFHTSLKTMFILLSFGCIFYDVQELYFWQKDNIHTQTTV